MPEGLTTPHAQKSLFNLSPQLKTHISLDLYIPLFLSPSSTSQHPPIPRFKKRAVIVVTIQKMAGLDLFLPLFFSFFFSLILAITNQMNAYGVKQPDLGIIDKVLRTLTQRFDHIVVAIEQGQNLEEMKIEELQRILEAQEMRLNEKNLQRSAEQAMQA